MTVTLNLKPEIEAGLLGRARASGMSLEQYLLYLVESAARPNAANAPTVGQPARIEAVRRMLKFGEEYHFDLGEPITRKLPHEGHRF
jgi:hypothetical protein